MTDQKKKEWERLYDQLGFGKGTMRDPLLAILFLAKSQTAIERLNDGLLPTCQVLNRDLPALKRVRAVMEKNGGPDLEDMQRLLTSLAEGSRSMELRYEKVLTEGREKCDFNSFYRLSNTHDRAGRYIGNLRSTLFGENVDVKLSLSPDRKTLGVRIVKWTRGLTRDYVQKLLSHEVLRTLPHGDFPAHSREKGTNLDYWLLLDAQPYHELIEGSCMILDGFTEKLEVALYDLGLEIGPIVPDLTTADNGR